MWIVWFLLYYSKEFTAGGVEFLCGILCTLASLDSFQVRFCSLAEIFIFRYVTRYGQSPCTVRSLFKMELWLEENVSTLLFQNLMNEVSRSYK